MDEVDKHSNITKPHRRQAYNVPKKEVGHRGLQSPPNATSTPVFLLTSRLFALFAHLHRLCQPRGILSMEEFDFDAILADTPYKTLYSCIDSFPHSDLPAELTTFSRQNPSTTTLSPLLDHCLAKSKLPPFHELLRLGVKPDEHTVYAAACNEDESFLIALLNYGWPVAHSLRRGQIPSLLW